MNSSENIQSLQQILDFIRMGGILLLLVHFYCVCYPAIVEAGLNIRLLDNLIFNQLLQLKIIQGGFKSKLTVLLLLAVSMLGGKGKKEEDYKISQVLFLLLTGLLLYFTSSFLLSVPIVSKQVACLYIATTTIGYLFILSGGARATRLLSLRFKGDVFNENNETFPQEERLLTNEYSVNLPAQYNLKGKIRRSFINIINPFRALLVLGTPGSRWKDPAKVTL